MIALDRPQIRLMPTRALGLLIAIGVIDLLVTAYLHAHGLIIELNPLMRPLIERSEWLFALVKGMTLVAAYIVMVWYSKFNLSFVRKVCVAGSAAYVVIWCVWFFGAA